MSENPFETASEPNYLENLVGEGKKFKTVDDLAKGKAEADKYIETLTAEVQALKAQTANGMNVEKLMEEIRKINKGQDDTPQDPHVRSATETNTPNIEDIVLQTLRKTETERLVQTNTQQTISKMNEVWGKDAGANLSKVAAEIGTSVQNLQQIAAQSPSMFYRLTGLDQTATPTPGTIAPTSTVRFEGNGKKDRTMQFYRELKKTNRALYDDTKTQIQMQRDAQRLGEAFFD